jgi:hypothetical protein
MHFDANCHATTVGSLPLSDEKEATQWVFHYTPRIPAWVQLPKRPKEGMITQFIEGTPGIVWSERKAYFDTQGPTFEEETVRFYEDYLEITENDNSKPLENFALTDEYAIGFGTFVDTVRSCTQPPLAIKCQITGPFTLGMGLTDQANQSAYFNAQLRDIVVKTLCLKTKWQLTRLRDSTCPIIVFIDEPALVGFGSSTYVSVSREDIQKDLREIGDVVHGHGGLVGVHCCENTDWSVLLEAGIDILSFDAYGYFDKVMIYRDDLKRFIERGGILSWGIVPTLKPEELEREGVASLSDQWHRKTRELAEIGLDVDVIVRHSLITPSCGAGVLARRLAEKALSLTRGVSEALRKKYGLTDD